MKYLTLVILALFCPVNCLAQGICVADSFNVSAVKGKVMAHLENRDEPLQNISLRIFRQYKLKKPLYQTQSNENGEFEIDALKPGNYTLIAGYKGLLNFQVDLVIVPIKKKATDKTLLIWMGADFAKPCGGSYAELK